MTTADTRDEPLRWVIVAAVAVVGLLHVLGALQLRDQVDRGFRSTDDGVIAMVTQGGPADRPAGPLTARGHDSNPVG